MLTFSTSVCPVPVLLLTCADIILWLWRRTLRPPLKLLVHKVELLLGDEEHEGAWQGRELQQQEADRQGGQGQGDRGHGERGLREPGHEPGEGWAGPFTRIAEHYAKRGRDVWEDVHEGHMVVSFMLLGCIVTWYLR